LAIEVKNSAKVTLLSFNRNAVFLVFAIKKKKFSSEIYGRPLSDSLKGTLPPVVTYLFCDCFDQQLILVLVLPLEVLPQYFKSFHDFYFRSITTATCISNNKSIQRNLLSKSYCCHMLF